MPSSTLPLMLAALLVWGCSGKTDPAEPMPPPTTGATPAKKAAAAPTPEKGAAAPKMVDGSLTRVDGAWRFQPEGGAQALPVPTDVAAAIGRVAIGDATPSRAALLLAGDDGPVVGWRCIGCGAPGDDVRWAMHGNEPFWTLTMRADGAEWTSPETDTVKLEIAAGGDAGPWTLKSADGKLTVEVRIEDKGCSDTMSDARWHATAQLKVDGYAREGCAIAGR